MARTKIIVWTLSLLMLGRSLATSTKSNCCSLLQSQYQDHVFFPNSTGYQMEAAESYWSGTAILSPRCVFTPTTAEIVSEAISTLSKNNCSIAIRSGGHSTAEGSNNIDDGILLATTNLSSITLGDGFASVGPGLRWGAVYNFLEPHGLVVVGGRGEDVGVGGLVLGGGVSHFTPKHGLACDNVKGFQIVTACGEIVEANVDSHADLWQALKGSQNTLGVVTRLDLYTIPSPQLHVVSSSVDMVSFDQLAEVYHDYIRLKSGGENAQSFAVGLVSYYVPFLGAPSLSLALVSTMGHNESPWLGNGTNGTTQLQLPPALTRFEELPLKSFTEERGSMASFANGSVTPSIRYDLRTMSFRSSVEMMKGMRQIFEEEIARVQETDASFSGIIEWQLITENAIAQGIQKGGNILGLDTTAPAPLILFAMANSWSDPAGDEASHSAGQRILERGESLARELGVYASFVYANYAAKGQDVISSYGEKNVARINKMKEKYDSRNLLPSLIPGRLG